MDILIVWIDDDTQKERAKIYHNIDPKRITIDNCKLFFAHPDVYNTYQIPLDYISYMTSDTVQIKNYVALHPDTINGSWAQLY